MKEEPKTPIRTPNNKEKRVPQISPYAQSLKRDGSVFDRLYEDSVRRSSPKKEDQDKEKTFAPEISPLSKNLRREGKIYDRLYTIGEKKNEKINLQEKDRKNGNNTKN
eukprot:TRINITY_DN3321_c1_g1_i1.p1 TRINITY_DN3321_c1_g1~~TRINITY_DN3321_c1_g1_i1.p1  ORF type:complete len:108 (+),score=45.92 TRINITY_DN3321_c1_g1_i1:1-324(+)